jgi:hypothetical protein
MNFLKKKKSLLGPLHLRVLGVAFFVWLPLCFIYQFKMPFIFIVLAFTFQGAFRAMLKMFTLMLTSSPSNKVALFLQVSSPPMIHPGFIPLVS